MFEIPAPQRARAAALYRSAEAFFPLIAAVLDGHQDGIVYGDDPIDPEEWYVEHAFGFAQMFGRPDPAFELALARHLSKGAFRAAKVRLYGSRVPERLMSSRFDPLRSVRQRFRQPSAPSSGTAPRSARPDVRPALETDLSEIQALFGVVGRFWRSPADFLLQGRPSLAFHDGGLAAICYAAAEADGLLEIDVATRPEMRRRGLALEAASDFIARSRDASLEPLWDCFTNNAASVALSRSLGFQPVGDPYSFFTFAR